MLQLTLAELVLPARARVLVMHATEAEPLLELRDLTAGGTVVAVAPDLAAYTALQAAIGPRAGADVTVTLEQFDAPGEPTFAAALLDSDAAAGRGNAYVRRLIEHMARQVRPGGQLWLEGSPRRGVRTFARYLEAVSEPPEQVSVGGGRRTFRAVRPEMSAPMAADAPPEIEAGVRGLRLRLQLGAGVFAGRGLDEATALLIEHMPIRPRDRVLDLGCGAGAIGIAAALLAPSGNATLADANPLATQLAEANIRRNGAPNAAVVLSDVYSALEGQRFDLIATNPPFHVRAEQSRDVAEAFLRGAPAHLRPNGRLCVVANAFLPYERLLADLFPAVETLAANGRYKVLLGSRRRERASEQL